MTKVAWKTIVALLLALVAVNVIVLLLLPEQRDLLTTRLSNAISYSRARGFECRNHTGPDGTMHRYAVFVPYAMKPDDRLPMIVYLNGFGKNGNDGVAQLKDGLAPALWEKKGRFPFVAVFPQCPKGQAWTDNGVTERLAIDIMNDVAAEFHTDPDRVLLTGLSSGASGVWSIAASHPDLFAGIVPISAGGVSDEEIRRIAVANVPVWSFYVGQDNTSVVEGNRRAKRLLLGHGRSPRFTEIQTSDVDVHMNLHDAWSYAYRNAALMDWMWRQNRSRRSTTDDLLTLHEAEWLLSQDDVKHDAVSVSDDGFSVTPETAGHKVVPLPLTAGKVADIHLEFLPADGIRRCGLGVVRQSDKSTVTGWAVEACVDDSASGGMCRLPDFATVFSGLPESAFAFCPGEWNELRVRIDGRKVWAELNGWPIVDAVQVDDADAGGQLVLTANGDSTAAVNYRFFRTRDCVPIPEVRFASQFAAVRESDDHPRQVNPETVTLEVIERAWQSWSTESATIRWQQLRGGFSMWSGFCASLPSFENSAVSGGMMRLGSGRIECQSPWLNGLTRVSRTRGLIADASNDFRPNLGSRFESASHQYRQPLLFLSLCDGESRLDSIASDDGSTICGIAFDRTNVRDVRIGDLSELIIFAPVLAVSPLSAYGGNVRLNACHLQNGTRWLADVSVVVLTEFVNDSGTVRRDYWLDPAREFRILRLQTRQNDQLREQIDMTYTTDRSCGWRPSAWTVIAGPQPAKSTSDRFFPGNQRLFEYASAVVTEWSINDPATEPVRPVRFPVGTAFFDQRTNQWLEQVRSETFRPLDRQSIARLASGANPQKVAPFFTAWPILIASILAGIFIAVRRTRSKKVKM